MTNQQYTYRLTVGRTEYVFRGSAMWAFVLKVWSVGPTTTPMFDTNGSVALYWMAKRAFNKGILTRLSDPHHTPLYDMPESWVDSMPFTEAAWPTIRMAFLRGKVHVSGGPE